MLPRPLHFLIMMAMTSRLLFFCCDKAFLQKKNNLGEGKGLLLWLSFLGSNPSLRGVRARTPGKNLGQKPRRNDVHRLSFSPWLLLMQISYTTQLHSCRLALPTVSKAPFHQQPQGNSQWRRPQTNLIWAVLQ